MNCKHSRLLQSCGSSLASTSRSKLSCSSGIYRTAVDTGSRSEISIPLGLDGACSDRSSKNLSATAPSLDAAGFARGHSSTNAAAFGGS
jgi:hypothetical protein